MTEPSHGDAGSDQGDVAPTDSPEEPPPEGEATPEQPVVHNHGVPTTVPPDAASG
jgi:hypothetical protein